MYGLLVWLVAGLPGALSMILLINLPLGLVVCWAGTGLVLGAVNGAINAAINK
jgi:hypothetical protein